MKIIIICNAEIHFELPSSLPLLNEKSGLTLMILPFKVTKPNPSLLWV